MLKKRIDTEILNLLFDSTDKIIVLISKDGVIQRINQPGLDKFGLDAKKIKGKPFTELFDIIPKHSLKRLIEGFRAHLNNERVDPYITDFFDKDKNIIVMRVSGRAVIHKNEVCGVVCILEDIANKVKSSSKITSILNDLANLFNLTCKCINSPVEQSSIEESDLSV